MATESRLSTACASRRGLPDGHLSHATQYPRNLFRWCCDAFEPES